MAPLGFHKFALPSKDDLFHSLSDSVEFETVGKGRQGNHLAKLGESGVPIVRTTTQYQIQAHDFSPAHRALAESIQTAAGPRFPNLAFNHALIEIYDRSYFKMGYHSDQALDLADDSCIALFSCYERPDELSEKVLRKLKIKSKTTGEESEVVLDNNSVVLFSLGTNTQFVHKIVLEPLPSPSIPENRWLGITFRRSKTLVQFKDGRPHFPNGEPLRLADEAQRKEFFRLRGQENREMNFEYPELAYTLSPGDTLMPRDGRK